jgi:hypothetical protein
MEPWRRQPWRRLCRTPEGPAASINGSPPPISAPQPRITSSGEPGHDPWRGADHGGACGSGAHRELIVSDGSEAAAAQRIQSDSAPHCSLSSSALCSAEETGTRRQERTGWAAESSNQIRAQAGSRPGARCWMLTELIVEVGVGMASFVEDSRMHFSLKLLATLAKSTQNMEVATLRHFFSPACQQTRLAVDNGKDC